MSKNAWRWIRFLVTFIVLFSVLTWIALGDYYDKISSTVKGQLTSISNKNKTGDYTVTIDVIRSESTDDDQDPLAYQNVYQHITQFAADGTIKPGISDNWKKSSDGLSWSFHIKQGLSFSDGSSITTGSIIEALRKNISSMQSDSVDRISIDNIGSIEGTDENIVIRLKKPTAALPWLMAGKMGKIYKTVGRSSDAPAKKGIVAGTWMEDLSSGQYLCETITTGKEYRFRLNDKTKYEGIDENSPDSIIVKMTDDKTAVDDLNSGKAKYVVSQKGSLSGITGKVHEKHGQSTTRVALLFNGSTNRPYPALGDRRFRQGIRQMIDSKALMDAVPYHEDAVLIGGATLPGTLGYEDLTGVFPYDWHKGRQAATSYFGIYRMKVIYPSSMKGMAGIIEANLRQADQYVTLQEIPDTDYTSALTSGDYDIAVSTINGVDGFRDLLDGNARTNTDMPDVDAAYSGIFTAADDNALANAIKNTANVQNEWSPVDWLFAYSTHVYTADGYNEPDASFSDVHIDLTQFKKSTTSNG